MIGEVVAALFALVGGMLSLSAGIGVLRMPDTITRMHAASKVSAAGSGMALMAAAAHFGDPTIATRCAVAIGLVMLSTPAAAHLLARAARHGGAPLSERTAHDEYPLRALDDDARGR